MIEDRTGNLISTGFARDFHMKGELALREDGKMLGLRVKMLSDQGYAFADAQPTKFKAGFFHIVTGSYDLRAAHVVTDGAYTNKAPGGVAYRCSFRVTEASYLIERLVQTAAYELGLDPVELRRPNFIKPEQFPYDSATGLRLRLGDYERAPTSRSSNSATRSCARSSGARARRTAARIGVARFTEVVGAGPQGLRHPRDQDVRLGRAAPASDRQGDSQARRQVAGPGPRDDVRADRGGGAGIPPEDIRVEEGDTDTTPYGLGTYASRSTPTAGAATALIARTLREKAKKIAAHLLEASEDDLDWDGERSVKVRPTARRRSRRSSSPPTRTCPREWTRA